LLSEASLLAGRIEWCDASSLQPILPALDHAFQQAAEAPYVNFVRRFLEMPAGPE